MDEVIEFIKENRSTCGKQDQTNRFFKQALVDKLTVSGTLMYLSKGSWRRKQNRIITKMAKIIEELANEAKKL